MHTTFKIAALAAAITLAGCASLPPGLQGFMPNSPDTYSPAQSQNAEQVRIGTVIAVRAVEIQPSGTERLAASGAGAALGGLLGHQIGGGKGKTLATVAGVVGGAIGGNLAGNRVMRQPGQQITVRLDRSGWNASQVIEVTQAASPAVLVGERVEVIGSQYGYDQPVRVEPLSAGAVPPPAPRQARPEQVW